MWNRPRLAAIRATLALGALALVGEGCGVANAPVAEGPDLAEVAGPVATDATPTPSAPAERPPPVPWPMGWCAAWGDEVGAAREAALGGAHAVDGRVVIGGAGTPPAPCAYVAKYASNLEEESLPDASWVRVRERSSGRELVLAVALEGYTLPARPGTTLVISEALHEARPLSGQLLVRGGDGRPLLWMGTAPSLDELHPPVAVAFARGEPVASSEWTCGTWSAYDLRVELGATAHTLGYGQRMAAEDYEIFHGGLIRDLQVDRCIDASMAQAWVAMLWRTPAAPAAPRRRGG